MTVFTKQLLLALLMVALGAVSETASAQLSSLADSDIVIKQDGTLNSPWVEQTICPANEACLKVVRNPVTREIASIDGQLSTVFKQTGAGREVIRVKRGKP